MVAFALIILPIALAANLNGHGKCYLASRPPPKPQLKMDGTCLGDHNAHRKFAGLPTISWDSSLQTSAQLYANYLHQTDKFVHSGAKNKGENLYRGYGGASCSNALNMWMNERRAYRGQAIGSGDFKSYGHFSQVMYPELRNVGCASAGAVVVCHYDPPQMVGVQLRNY